MTKPVKQRHPLEPPVTARQEMVPGFSQDKLSRSRFLLVGGGGLGGEIGHGLVRKGVGALTILDHDQVELTNLVRQRFFQRDIGKNKAISLARNLRPEATGQTKLTGYAMSFEDAAKETDLDADVVVCGVDNDRTRVAVASHFLCKRPVVIAGVSNNADAAYVFVQEPGSACFLCQFPDSAQSQGTTACVPSEIAILKTICGLALYAIDSLLMPRPRAWNYRALSLAGSWEERMVFAKPRSDCELCAQGRS